MLLRDRSALLVGSDARDSDGMRSVHSTLLGHEMLIVEHWRGLEQSAGRISRRDRERWAGSRSSRAALD